MRSAIYFIFCCLLFWACQSDNADRSDIPLPGEDRVSVATEVPLAPNVIDTNGVRSLSNASTSDLGSAHRADRPSEIETIPGIDIALNHRITGPRGETILIPANSLVNAIGDPVSGEVQVTWNAALTMSGMFSMRAPTVANGTLLGSGGAIYLEAEQEGLPLRIKDGMEWKVTVPSEPITLFPEETMKVFNGRRDRGEVLWSLEPVERIETIPITYKYFLIDRSEMIGRSHFLRMDSLAKKFPITLSNSVIAPSAEFVIGRDKARIADLVLPFYNDPKFRKTYVCSLPFLARLRVLTEHIFGLTRTVNDIHYVDERSGANEYIIDILNIYRDHANGPLFIPDSIAYALLMKSEAINPRTPSTTAIHIRKLRGSYKEFVAQGLGHPIEINDRGVDLDEPDAFDQLVRGGLTLTEANKIMEESADRRACIDGLKVMDIVEPVDDGSITESWTKVLPDGRRAVVRKRQTYSVRFTGVLGYLNIDRFIGPEFTEPTNVFVTLQGPELRYERVSMFFPSLNGYVELRRDPDSRIYRLPKELRRLPIGQPMAMLAIGQNDSGFAYHIVEGTLDRNLSLRLEPRNGEMNELTDRLSKI